MNEGILAAGKNFGERILRTAKADDVQIAGWLSSGIKNRNFEKDTQKATEDAIQKLAKSFAEEGEEVTEEMLSKAKQEMQNRYKGLTVNEEAAKDVSHMKYQGKDIDNLDVRQETMDWLKNQYDIENSPIIGRARMYKDMASGYFGDENLGKGRKIIAGTAYAGLAVGGRVLSGGSLTHNSDGERDIAGIPFI